MDETETAEVVLEDGSADNTASTREVAEVSLKPAQAQNVNYWVERRRDALAELRVQEAGYQACLSAIVAGARDGVWNVDAITTQGDHPHLVISRGG